MLIYLLLFFVESYTHLWIKSLWLSNDVAIMRSPPRALARQTAKEKFPSPISKIRWRWVYRPLANDADGNPVMLSDIWPSEDELRKVMAESITPEMFRDRYGDVMEEERWDSIPAESSDL